MSEEERVDTRDVLIPGRDGATDGARRFPDEFFVVRATGVDLDLMHRDDRQVISYVRDGRIVWEINVPLRSRRARLLNATVGRWLRFRAHRRALA